MRLDRILSEGESVNALRQLGFIVQDADHRPGLFEVSHPRIGGARVFTIEQLNSFAEGAQIVNEHFKALSATPSA